MPDFLDRTEFYTVLVYLLLMIGIGFYFVRRNKGGLDYFTGGRQIPWWVSGVSLYMGNFSAWLFTGGAGMLYRTTWYGLLYFLLTGSVAYYIGSQITAARWRRTRVMSPVEFTRRRFGIGTQQLLGIITAVVFLAAAGNQLKAISTVVNSVLGIDLVTAAWAIGIIVILYTLIGGLWAVMVTDVVQFVVLLAATLLIAPLALLLVKGGLPEIFSAMGSFSVPPEFGNPNENGHFLIAGVIAFTLGVASGQGPRFYCVPDEDSARKVGKLAAFLFLTTPVIFSIPSLVARAYWPGGPEALGTFIPGKAPHEQVFIRISMEVLPPGLLGIFLAAMFAATMSALDSVYNMIASIFSRDMYMHFKPKTTDRSLILVGRVMTVVCGLATIGICLFYMGGSSDLFKVMTDIFFLSAPVMAVPIFLGFFLRKAPRAAGMASILWGILTGVVAKFFLRWETGPQVYLVHSVAILIFVASPYLGALWSDLRRKVMVPILAVVVGAASAGILWLLTPDLGQVLFKFGKNTYGAPYGMHEVIAVYGVLMGLSTLWFASWFARREDQSGVKEFYEKLDTPVDVKTEATGSAEAALSVFRLVGVLTFVIAGLTALMGVVERFTHPELADQWPKYAALTGILVILGILFYSPSRRTEATSAG